MNNIDLKNDRRAQLIIALILIAGILGIVDVNTSHSHAPASQKNSHSHSGHAH